MQKGLPKPQKNLYSIGEASRLLNVSIGTIRRWDRAGTISTSRTPGGTRLIPHHEIKRIQSGGANKPGRTQVNERLISPQKVLNEWDKLDTGKIQKDPKPLFVHRDLDSIETSEGHRLLSLPKPIADLRKQTSETESPIDRVLRDKSLQSQDLKEEAASKRISGVASTLPQTPSEPHKKLLHIAKYSRPNWYRNYHNSPIHRPLHIAILGLFLLLSANFMFGDMIEQALQTQRLEQQEIGELLATVTPPRVLSFQGRLTDSSDVPITSATTIEFRIYTSTSGNTGDPCATTCLWESKQWSVTPDQNGIFSVLLGNTGQGDNSIGATVFTDNDLPTWE